jgi:RNA polymerase sigma-70 factor, ECF subfamily
MSGVSRSLTMQLLDDETWREELPPLRRFALSLTREPAAADDLVQATFERALSRGEQRRHDGSLRAWLFSILYRRFLDSQRGRRRLRRFLAVLHLRVAESAAPSPEETFLASAELRVFAALPEQQRAILLLVGVEGLSYQEAADVLGVPIGTVMSRLSRARATLSRAASAEADPPRALRLVR